MRSNQRSGRGKRRAPASSTAGSNLADLRHGADSNNMREPAPKRPRGGPHGRPRGRRRSSARVASRGDALRGSEALELQECENARDGESLVSGERTAVPSRARGGSRGGSRVSLHAGWAGEDVDKATSALPVASGGRGRRSEQNRGRGRSRGRGRGRGARGGLFQAGAGGNITAASEDPNEPEPDLPPSVEADNLAEVGRGYFDAHRPTAARTSRATLADARLPQPRVLAEAMARLPVREAAASRGPDMTSWEALRRYSFFVNAGHSLLFYGFGSKFAVLEAVAQYLADESGDERAVFAIDGFCPGLSLRSLLGQVAAAVIPSRTEFPKRHLLDYVRAISEAVTRRNQGSSVRKGVVSDVILVVHNIDGVPLRSPDAQNALSELARVRGISIVASIDHVNAPLLWDADMSSHFNWAWFRVETWTRYTREMAFSSRPLLRGSDETRVEAAVILLNSLSPNARKVFNLLAEMQYGSLSCAEAKGSDIKGQKDATRHEERSDRTVKCVAVGQSRRVTFMDLFSKCRDEFLATDPTSLKTFLNELQTHDLLDRRKGSDAAEQLWIPLSKDQTRTVLQTID